MCTSVATGGKRAVAGRPRAVAGVVRGCAMSDHRVRRKYRAHQTRNRLLNALQSSLVVSLLAHWVFQGLLYMDRTERWLKVGFDFVVTIAALITFSFDIAMSALAFLFAHTLNLLLNGHILGVLKSFDISFADKEGLSRYLEQLTRRVKRAPSVGFAGVYGSLARGTLTGTSDLDIRVVSRTDDLWCQIRCALFATRERTIALVQGIPLDIYSFGSEAALAARDMRESPLVLKSSGAA